MSETLRVVVYNIGLKTILQQFKTEPISYGDLVYKFNKIVIKPIFRDHFKDITKRYKLEDLKVLKRSPDLLNKVKIGQGKLRLIIQTYFVLPYMGRGHFDQVT